MTYHLRVTKNGAQFTVHNPYRRLPAAVTDADHLVQHGWDHATVLDVAGTPQYTAHAPTKDDQP